MNLDFVDTGSRLLTPQYYYHGYRNPGLLLRPSTKVSGVVGVLDTVPVSNIYDPIYHPRIIYPRQNSRYLVHHTSTHTLCLEREPFESESYDRVDENLQVVPGPVPALPRPRHAPRGPGVGRIQ